MWVSCVARIRAKNLIQFCGLNQKCGRIRGPTTLARCAVWSTGWVPGFVNEAWRVAGAGCVDGIEGVLCLSLFVSMCACESECILVRPLICKH